MRTKYAFPALAKILIIYSCTGGEKTVDNQPQSEKANDRLYDSLGIVLNEKRYHQDSLYTIFQEEITGIKGSRGYGKEAKRIDSELRAYELEIISIQTKLDSLLNHTSKKYQQQHYSRIRNEWDAALKEMQIERSKIQTAWEAEKQGGAFGVEAKKLEMEISILEKKINSAQRATDSISFILNKLK